MSETRDPKHNEMLRQFVESRVKRMMAGSIDRRTFLKKSAAAAAAGVGAASLFTSFTPSAVAAARKVLQQTGDSAEAAVAAARKLKEEGKVEKLTIISEAALQAEDPKVFSGPLWKELTGIDVEVIEKPFDEMFPTMVQEHIAGTGAIDVLQVVPLWLADCVNQGIVEPLSFFFRLGERTTWENAYALTSEAGEVRLVCDPDRVFGPTPNGALVVRFLKDAAPDMVVVLAKSGEQARLPVKNGISAQATADAADWAKMVATFRTGGEFALVTSADSLTFETAPLPDLACE